MTTVRSILGVSVFLTALVGCAATNPSPKERVVVPEDKAIALALARVPGKLVHTRLAQVGDRYVYQIEIRDQNETNWWVQVDATDGDPVERQTRPRLKY